MKRIISFLVCILLGSIFLTGCHKNVSQLSSPKVGDTVAEIKVSNYGTIYVKFFEKEAPKAVENFITHAKKGYYDGQSFYRIIEGSLMESGDPTKTGTGGESIWGKDFEDEFAPDLQPYYGALCMTNSGPDKNNSSYFIVQSDKTYNDELLNQIEKKYKVKFKEKARKLYASRGGSPWFYQRNTVFGQVYDGYSTLEKIAKVDKKNKELGVPMKDVVISKVSIVKKK